MISGYISFDENGTILISKRLSEINRKAFNILEDMSISISDGMKKYMKYHNEHIFVDNVE